MCDCSTGWTGIACSVCAANFFGAACDACPGGAGNACSSHGVCDESLTGNGSCDCDRGWMGAACAACASGFGGSECGECPGGAASVCSGHGSCNDTLAGDRTCSCESGWRGTACDDCALGFFGVDCSACPGGADTPCSGHGDCAGSGSKAGAGTCTCDQGWEGSACSGCAAGYFGADCTACPGGAANVCSGNGVCDGDSTTAGSGACTCDVQFAGADCSICASGYFGAPGCTACPGGGGAAACSGHGTCDSEIGTCACQLGWQGETCDDCAAGFAGADCEACPGGASSPCSGHGVCAGAGSVTGNGTCSCDAGWAGADCGQCQFGFFGSNCGACPAAEQGGAICSAHGTCAPSSSAGCECDAGWKGLICDACELGHWGANCTECPGGASNPCSSHGVCNADNGGCQCFPNWRGDTCDTCAPGFFGAVCTACPGGEDNACTGHGACAGTGTTGGDGSCSCDAGWGGVDCSGCLDGFAGPACAACPGGADDVCSAHGVCVGSGDVTAAAGRCECQQGWAGEDCSMCAPGFFGASCDACPGGYGSSACSGRGSCSDGLAGDGNCTCDVGYVGDACLQCDDGFSGSAACNECPGGADTPCSLNGVCNVTCTCNEGWTGAACAMCDAGYFGPSCTACPGGAAVPCSAHGVCEQGLSGSGLCDCAAGWDGATCDVCAAGHAGASCAPCAGGHVTPCSGHGACSLGLAGDGSCECDAGWAGVNCSICAANFFGADCTACPAGADNACSGHGVCDASLTGDGSCACATGWAGSACSVCASGFFGATCAACTGTLADGAVCSGHGTCSDGLDGAGSCTCAPGWQGAPCDTQTETFVLPTAATFHAAAASVNVEFTVFGTPLADGSPQDFAAQSGDCSAVWEDAASLLGSTAVCRWTSTSSMLITLAPGATLLPVFNIVSNGDACPPGRSLDVLPDVTTVSGLDLRGCVPVAPPVQPAPPVPVVVGPTSVGSCSGITLDASSSSGSGGRDFAVSWSSPTLDEHVGSESGLQLAVPASALAAGETYTVTLTLTNFFQQVGSYNHTFTVANAAVPTVSIAGESSRTLRRSASLSLRATAVAAACPGTDAPAPDSLQWTWQDISPAAPAQLDLTGTSASPRVINLAAYALQVGSYRLQARASLPGAAADEYGEATVDLQVVAGAVVAVIGGGGERTVSASGTLRLDGSASRDEDVRPGEPQGLMYSWKRVAADGSVIGGELASTALLTVDSAELAQLTSQTVLYRLVVTSADDRSASATTAVIVLDDAVPDVSVTPLEARVNPGQAVRLVGAVTAADGGSADDAEVMWSVVAGDFDRTTPDAYFASPLAATSLALREGVLTAGVSYTFLLTASLPGSSSAGFASLSFTVNAPPSSGSVSLTPRSGTALQTAFTVTAQLWADAAEDLPLSYAFSVLPVAGDALAAVLAADIASAQLDDDAHVAALLAALPSGQSATLLVSRQEDGSKQLLLPSAAPTDGTTADNSTIVMVTVWDAFGARVRSARDGAQALPRAHVQLPAAAGGDSDAAQLVDVLTDASGSGGTLDTLEDEEAVRWVGIAADMLVDLCANVDCGMHGDCGSGICACRDGYTGASCSQPPAVDGMWGDWSAWTQCSVACGAGLRARRRACDSPAPSFGGSACAGNSTEAEACQQPACEQVVDGGYSQWSEWSPCSASCPDQQGGLFPGTRTRSRQCDSPLPSATGTSCVDAGLGAALETQACNTAPCPAPLKSCPTGSASALPCNGRGSCMRTPQSCSAGDPACTARCMCDDGFGGAACERTEAELASARQLRRQLLDAVVSSSSGVDRSDGNVLQLISTVRSVTAAREEVDAAARDTAVSFVRDIAQQSVDAGAVSPALAEEVLGAFGNLLAAAEVEDSSGGDAGRRLQQSASSVRSELAPLLAGMSHSLLAGRLAGEEALLISSAAITLAAAKLSSAEVVLPLGEAADVAAAVRLPAGWRGGGSEVRAVAYNVNPHGDPALAVVAAVDFADDGGADVAVSGQTELPLVIELPLAVTVQDGRCAFWDAAAGNWSSAGVALTGSSLPAALAARGMARISCSALHATDFTIAPAASVASPAPWTEPADDRGTWEYNPAQSTVLSVLGAVAGACAFLALLGYCMDRRQHEDAERVADREFRYTGRMCERPEERDAPSAIGYGSKSPAAAAEASAGPGAMSTSLRGNHLLVAWMVPLRHELVVVTRVYRAAVLFAIANCVLAGVTVSSALSGYLHTTTDDDDNRAALAAFGEADVVNAVIVAVVMLPLSVGLPALARVVLSYHSVTDELQSALSPDASGSGGSGGGGGGGGARWHAPGEERKLMSASSIRRPRALLVLMSMSLLLAIAQLIGGALSLVFQVPLFVAGGAELVLLAAARISRRSPCMHRLSVTGNLLLLLGHAALLFAATAYVLLPSVADFINGLAYSEAMDAIGSAANCCGVAVMPGNCPPAAPTCDAYITSTAMSLAPLLLPLLAVAVAFRLVLLMQLDRDAQRGRLRRELSSGAAGRKADDMGAMASGSFTRLDDASGWYRFRDEELAEFYEQWIKLAMLRGAVMAVPILLGLLSAYASFIFASKVETDGILTRWLLTAGISLGVLLAVVQPLYILVAGTCGWMRRRKERMEASDVRDRRRFAATGSMDDLVARAVEGPSRRSMKVASRETTRSRVRSVGEMPGLAPRTSTSGPGFGMPDSAAPGFGVPSPSRRGFGLPADAVVEEDAASAGSGGRSGSGSGSDGESSAPPVVTPTPVPAAKPVSEVHNPAFAAAAGVEAASLVEASAGDAAAAGGRAAAGERSPGRASRRGRRRNGRLAKPLAPMEFRPKSARAAPAEAAEAAEAEGSSAVAEE